MYFAEGISRDAPPVFMSSLHWVRAKNAGGHPPALGGPSIRGHRYIYSRSCVPGLREKFVWLEPVAAVVALWLPLALVAQQMLGLVE